MTIFEHHNGAACSYPGLEMGITFWWSLKPWMVFPWFSSTLSVMALLARIHWHPSGLSVAVTLFSWSLFALANIAELTMWHFSLAKENNLNHNGIFISSNVLFVPLKHGLWLIITFLYKHWYYNTFLSKDIRFQEWGVTFPTSYLVARNYS